MCGDRSMTEQDTPAVLKNKRQNASTAERPVRPIHQIKPLLLLLTALLVGCPEGKDTDTPDTSTPDTSDGLSECAEEILATVDEAYSVCFDEEITYGACETCGYWGDPSDTGTAEDCITCPDGFEIDVVFDDCSGHCVPQGTATTPLSASDCEAPDKPKEVRDSCFDGSIRVSPCETCGFYDDPEDAVFAADCITCPDGFEIDVIYGDCTGYCVPEGTAIDPVATADCKPTFECVRG